MTATVGLIRAGEMLSGQSSTILTKNGTVASNYSNVSAYWTLTPYDDSSHVRAWYVGTGNYLYNYGVNQMYAVRPVIVVNSTTSITSGNGTPSSPYQI